MRRKTRMPPAPLLLRLPRRVVAPTDEGRALLRTYDTILYWEVLFQRGKVDILGRNRGNVRYYEILNRFIEVVR